MKEHIVRVYPSKNNLKKENQLAWKLAECALDSAASISNKVCDMVINRMIDNAAVAIASLERKSVQHARDQAMVHPHPRGALIFGCSNNQKFFANWCAWANGTAVRELDFHDTFLAADYSHPADNIPPVLAAAQQKSCNGQQLLKGIVAAYEIHIALVKAICLHKHKIDHIAHLCPAQVAGTGALLSMDTNQLYQAINQAVHMSFNTRQSRKGAISSWKAYAPAHAGKLALEAVDRCLRGERSPSPIYEGEDSVIAWMLDGPEAEYKVILPEKGEEKKAILESYTKEHSAEYQSQALIDLAFEMRKQIYRTGIEFANSELLSPLGRNLHKPQNSNKISIKNLESIKEITIYTSHHTHYVIGTGSGDPEKQDPKANRETLDHSITYIFAVALEDGKWHHIHSYTPERAGRPETIRLWHKIKTCEDKEWTTLYHHPDPSEKSFGGRVEIIFKDGTRITGEKKRANAHPVGDKSFKRKDYIEKFMELSRFSPVEEKEKTRFLSLVQKLPELSSEEVSQLNVQARIPLQKSSVGLLD
ncbi:MAG: MmgE/PrpD family protein [Bdellovibrionales bacterium]|nr:MmgE/PrpD family protein [Bdellovibrionales bacterium]